MNILYITQIYIYKVFLMSSTYRIKLSFSSNIVYMESYSLWIATVHLKLYIYDAFLNMRDKCYTASKALGKYIFSIQICV